MPVVFRDPNGNVTKNKAVIVKGWKAAHDAAYPDDKTTATDEDILTAVREVDGDDNDDAVFQQRLDAVHNIVVDDVDDTEDDDTAGLSAVSADKDQQFAHQIGALMPKDMSSYMADLANKDEEVSGGVLVLADWIDRSPAFKAALENLNIRPGTRHDADPGTKEHPGNQRPDYYKRKVANREKPITGSEYQDIADGTTAGIYIQHVRGILNRVAKKETTQEDKDFWANIPNENSWEDLSAEKKFAAIKARWNRQRNGLGKRLRSAQSYRLQRAALEDARFKVFLVDDNLDVAHRKTLPIEIHFIDAHTGRTAISDPKSINTFNRINVPAALTLADQEGKQCNLSHLNETLKRTPTEPEMVPAIANAEELDEYISEVLAYADDAKNRTAVRKYFAGMSNEDVEGFQEFVSCINGLWKLVEPRWNKMASAKAAAEHPPQAGPKAA